MGAAGRLAIGSVPRELGLWPDNGEPQSTPSRVGRVLLVYLRTAGKSKRNLETKEEAPRVILPYLSPSYS